MTRNNLPAFPTPFIGRADEISELSQLLDNPDCRLLTLIGLGGIGKTRLAVEVAQRVQTNFPDGVFFVPLQPLQAPNQIIMTVLNAIDLKVVGNPHADLLAYMGEKQLLLVIDNFEHLLDGVDLLSEILSAAPRVKILTTSREALNLQEEWLRQIHGLTYPASGISAVVHTYSALQLFYDRSHRLRGDIDFAAQHDDIVRICQLVEGMPLALELAAGWVKTLSCRDIADELQQSQAILAARVQNAATRHHSMQTVFDHSWHMLTVHEQIVLRRFAVFRGGCTREAAEQVTGSTLNELTSLVEKSLLRHDPASGRYDMHELLRQYADEQRILAGDGNEVSDSHATYFMTYLSKREQDMKGRRQLAALNEIKADFENIRVAWYWTLATKNYSGLEQATESLFHFCEMQGWFQAGHELLGSAHDQLTAEITEDMHAIQGRIRVRAIWMLRWEDYNLDGGAAIKAEIHDWLVLARQQADQPQIAFCLWLSGALGHLTGDFARVIPLLKESLALYTDMGDRFYMARVADWMGAVVGANGQIEEFISLSRQSLDLRRAIDDRFGMAASLVNLGLGALEAGQYARAKRYIEEMGRIYLEIGSGAWMVRMAAYLAWIAFQQGDFQECRAQAEKALEMTAQYSSSRVDGTDLARALLGMLATLDEDYARSWTLCEDGTSEVRPPNLRPEEGLAVAACGLEDYSVARYYFLKSLNVAYHWQDYRGMTIALPVAAILMNNAGYAERAVEILGLAFHHPASARAWMEQWPLLIRLRAHLEAELGTTAYAMAWENGRHSDLKAATAGLLLHFESDESQPAHSSKHNLIEPLSKREIEILGLIAEGLTNREIALRLFLAVGTIKAHASNIYGKLGVDNRTAAVARARMLNLL